MPSLRDSTLCLFITVPSEQDACVLLRWYFDVVVMIGGHVLL